MARGGGGHGLLGGGQAKHTGTDWPVRFHKLSPRCSATPAPSPSPSFAPQPLRPRRGPLAALSPINPRGKSTGAPPASLPICVHSMHKAGDKGLRVVGGGWGMHWRDAQRHSPVKQEKGSPEANFQEPAQGACQNGGPVWATLCLPFCLSSVVRYWGPGLGLEANGIFLY